MFTKEEIKQLEKYTMGAVIHEEDKCLIEELQNTSLATSGFHKEGNKVYETSRLTSLGYSLYKSSVENNSPIRRFFSGLMASTY